MLGYLQRKQQAAAAAAQGTPAALPTPQVPNLYSSVRHVPDMDDSMFTNTIQCFYDELDNKSDKAFAKQLHEVLEDMRKNGDIFKAGPQTN